MKKFIKALVVSCLFLSLISHLSSLSPLYAGAGTAGAQFLKISPSVSGASLGDASCARLGDISAVYYNAAILSSVKGLEGCLMHNKWIEEITLQNLTFGYELKNVGTIGLNVTMVGSGDIKKYDNTGKDLNESYTAGDMSAGLGYGRELGENLGVGVAVKMLSQKIENETASGFAADIGLVYTGVNAFGNKLPIGLSVNNLGGEMKFREVGDPLPMTIRLGASASINQLTIVSDIKSVSDRPVAVGLGVEYKVSIKPVDMALRCGYSTASTSDKLGGLSGVTAGLGFELKPLSLDIAFIPMGEVFDNTFRLSLGAKF